MIRNLNAARCGMLLLGGLVMPLLTTGCQSTIGGQTMPSAYYLRDDVQYFPHGPEFKLSRQVEAIDEYNLRQKGVAVQPAPQ